ncbi:MAG: mechanosensitive ion channel family protein [Bacteroidetes bacterium]|nr:MAG: mechanosensitive ion channel family protein [Bacteroidota bacterium]
MNSFFRDILAEVHQYYDGLVAFFPRLVMGIIILAITWFISRQISNAASRRLKKQMEDPLLAEFLATMARSLVFIFGLLFALKALGLGGITASILAGAGITAFIIGFALRDIGENFLAGILLAFKRPFRVGDFIETGAIKGRVIRLNIRDTHLKTPDGKDVYVPNAQFIKIPLINYTIDGFLRYDFLVGIPTSVDYQKAMKEISGAVNSTDGIITRRKKTEVFISGIAPGRVDVTVSFWIDTFKIRGSADSIRSEVFQRVQAVVEALA